MSKVYVTNYSSNVHLYNNVHYMVVHIIYRFDAVIENSGVWVGWIIHVEVNNSSSCGLISCSKLFSVAAAGFNSCKSCI